MVGSSVALAVSATAREVLCSRTYARAYFVVVLTNYVPLVWLLLGDVWARAPRLLVLETASTALLLVECLLKTAAEGAAKYTAQALNVVDVVALALSALLLAATPLVAAHCGAASLASASVLALRCCAQVLRFLCVFKKFVSSELASFAVCCEFHVNCFAPKNHSLYAYVDAKSLVTLPVDTDDSSSSSGSASVVVASGYPRRTTTFRPLSGPAQAAATTTTTTTVAVTAATPREEGYGNSDGTSRAVAVGTGSEDDVSGSAGFFTPDDPDPDTFCFVDETPSPPPPAALLQTPAHEVDAIEAAKRDLLLCERPEYCVGRAETPPSVV